MYEFEEFNFSPDNPVAQHGLWQAHVSAISCVLCQKPATRAGHFIPSDPGKYQIPAGCSLRKGGFAVFVCDHCFKLDDRDEALRRCLKPKISHLMFSINRHNN